MFLLCSTVSLYNIEQLDRRKKRFDASINSRHSALFATRNVVERTVGAPIKRLLNNCEKFSKTAQSALGMQRLKSVMSTVHSHIMTMMMITSLRALIQQKRTVNLRKDS